MGLSERDPPRGFGPAEAEETAEALVIGGGPAGLMAAQALQDAGCRVIVAEARPSLGRKLLMAGKSGLNLTKRESPERFLNAFGAAAPHMAPMLSAFGPEAVWQWAVTLGAAPFAGSTGRVFPAAMKASPLLRAWLGLLARRGADLRAGWRWQGFAPAGSDAGSPQAQGAGATGADAAAGQAAAAPGVACFATPGGPRRIRAKAIVLALGGASWPRLGSDGAWADLLAGQGVALTPFAPANMGFSIDWSERMARHFGQPVKGCLLRAGERESRGEFVISARGIEGGGIYALADVLRDGRVPLVLDLCPDRDHAALAARLARNPRESLSNRLRKGARLNPAAIALLNEWGRPLPDAPETLAARIKALAVPLGPARPLAEAISTAGGITWDGLDGSLQLRMLPGVFAAGEMLDWEAPTGGYLLTGCLATGAWAGSAAARLIKREPAARGSAGGPGRGARP